ncbi:hypothetical protein BHM03_00005606 [Ensete ventricosum]|nr:hypothetical protein BHM03_00005606 [Ensete ventricosum]
MDHSFGFFPGTANAARGHHVLSARNTGTSKLHNGVWLGNYADAIACYNEVLRIDPSAADGLVNRGNTFKEIGRVTEAIQDYVRAHVGVLGKLRLLSVLGLLSSLLELLLRVGQQAVGIEDFLQQLDKALGCWNVRKKAAAIEVGCCGTEFFPLFSLLLFIALRLQN